jgi:hypothetical protein
MKINEVTEGFAKYLGSNLAKQIGATGFADALLKSIGAGSIPPDSPTFFKDTAKVAKTVQTLVRASKNAGNKISTTDIGAILSKRLPTAWRAETNKAAVINAFATELQNQGVQIGNSPATGTPTWKMGDPIPTEDGEITPADGQLYKQVAAQYQKS